MKMLLVTAVAVALAVPLYAGATHQVAQTTSPLMLFVLAGQSNMTGLGMPPQAEDANARVVNVLPDGSTAPGVDPFQPGAGQGPILPFALKVLSFEPAAHIGIVDCAVNGSVMVDWQPGGVDYNACLSQVAAAQPLGNVAGVLFFQGESDFAAADAAAWTGRFQSFASQFRLAIGAPTVPLVYAQVGGYGRSDWDAIRAAQAAASITNGTMISTLDLPVQPAGSPHFTLASYTTVGKRFANAWWKLANPAGTCTTTPAPPPSSGGGGTPTNMMVGNVSAGGAIVSGTGFTVTHPGTGTYNVTFTGTPYATVPLVFATSTDGNALEFLKQVTVHGFQDLNAVTTTGPLTEGGFGFIVIPTG